ncbi:MAG: hypothetical protein HY554_13515 [Elusimicrobia bacterium]|nr:hypothetical protein [Elusimicrobiota bacterium]
MVSCPVFKSFIQGCGAQFGWDAASCRVRDPYGIITARPKSYVWSGNPKVGCSGDGPDGDPRGNPPGVACAEGYRLEVLHAFEWPGITGAGFNLSACVSESEPAAR